MRALPQGKALQAPEAQAKPAGAIPATEPRCCCSARVRLIPCTAAGLASPVRRRRGLRQALMPLMRGCELNRGEGKEVKEAAHAGMRLCRARLPCCATAEPCWRSCLEQAPVHQRMTLCHRAAARHDLAGRAREPTLTCCLRLHCGAVAEVSARRGRRDVCHKLRKVGR